MSSNLRCFPLSQTDGADSDFTYELFSVIIHKGGCYGGHYHVYIRDIDELGQWEPPVRTSVLIKAIRFLFVFQNVMYFDIILVHIKQPIDMSKNGQHLLCSYATVQGLYCNHSVRTHFRLNKA